MSGHTPWGEIEHKTTYRAAVRVPWRLRVKHAVARWRLGRDGRRIADVVDAEFERKMLGL